MKLVLISQAQKRLRKPRLKKLKQNLKEELSSFLKLLRRKLQNHLRQTTKLHGMLEL